MRRGPKVHRAVLYDSFMRSTCSQQSGSRVRTSCRLHCFRYYTVAIERFEWHHTMRFIASDVGVL